MAMIIEDEIRAEVSISSEETEGRNFCIRQVYLLERDHRTNYIRFMTHMPSDLKAHLSEEEFGAIVGEINELCQEACKQCKWENFIDVLTLFLFYQFYRNHFYRTVEKLKIKVKELNKKFIPRGIWIKCPSSCAFMHLEFDVGSLLTDNAPGLQN
jgi:hypothetical protein